MKNIVVVDYTIHLMLISFEKKKIGYEINRAGTLTTDEEEMHMDTVLFFFSFCCWGINKIMWEEKAPSNTSIWLRVPNTHPIHKFTHILFIGSHIPQFTRDSVKPTYENQRFNTILKKRTVLLICLVTFLRVHK